MGTLRLNVDFVSLPGNVSLYIRLENRPPNLILTYRTLGCLRHSQIGLSLFLSRCVFLQRKGGYRTPDRLLMDQLSYLIKNIFSFPLSLPSWFSNFPLRYTPPLDEGRPSRSQRSHSSSLTSRLYRRKVSNVRRGKEDTSQTTSMTHTPSVNRTEKLST